MGTVVRVEDLFFNVPARLKFLKRDQTERQQIDGLVTRYALAYPDVRFHLFHDERPALQTSGKGDRREVLANLYGVEIARQMLEVAYEDERTQVAGFISPVALTRSNRREMTFFVNGRWVQDASLSAALLQAYHTLLMVGRYPLAALFIQHSAGRGGRECAPGQGGGALPQPGCGFLSVSAGRAPGAAGLFAGPVRGSGLHLAAPVGPRAGPGLGHGA